MKNPNPDFLREEKLLSRALQNLVWPIGETGAVAPKQIQDDTKAGESTVYHWIEEGKMPGWALLKTMKLAAEQGDFTLIQMALPKGLVLMPLEEVTVDGCLDDEIGDMTESIGATRKKFNDGDIRGAKKSLSKAKRDMLKMEAEIKAKESQV